MFSVSEEVLRLHDRIEANVRLLTKNYLGNRYVPRGEFIRLKGNCSPRYGHRLG